MYVCMYVQSTLPAQIGTTGSIYRELLFCNLSLHMYNIVWAMLTIWDNWLAGKYMEGCGGDVSNLYWCTMCILLQPLVL